MADRVSRLTGGVASLIVILRVGWLRSGLDAAGARDVLWALTGSELYRMLVVERGWSSDRYQWCLADTLIAGLLVARPFTGSS